MINERKGHRVTETQRRKGRFLHFLCDSVPLWPFMAFQLWGVATSFAQTADSVSGCLGAVPEQTIAATPANYRTLLTGLEPGDRLLLAAGTYTQGLPITGLSGEPGRCITI